MAEISQSTQKLLSQYQTWYQSLQPKEGVSTIHVDTVASRVASFYEKIRGVVEWREEHLLRKTAIERILKRRLLLKKEGETIAEPFVKELIRGGHFPNDTIPESIIEEIQKIIDKYIFILENSPSSPLSAPQQNLVRSRGGLYNWILGIAACEVEEVLSPPLKENALIKYMFELMKERIALGKGIEINEKDLAIQIYVAIQRALFRLDPPTISCHLILKKYSDWQSPSAQLLTEFAKNIYSIWEKIEKDLNHPLAGKFYKICEKYDTPYLILGDIIAKGPMETQEILDNPEVLETKIKESYQGRLKKLRSRMKRAAIFSVISIFITKALVAFAVEIPFDKYVTDSLNYFTLGLNIAIPPLLMFFLILTIRPPKKTNLQIVIMEVMKIGYQTAKKDVYEIRPRLKKGIILNTVIFFIYFLSFVATFGLIIWGLTKINFGILSQVIFIIFICLIASAGVKIRGTTKELIVEEKKEGLFHGFTEIFAMPILRMGRWLSGQWTRYNVVIVLINALIDMPFQIFIEFFEHWRDFLREKKEEIY